MEQPTDGVGLAARVTSDSTELEVMVTDGVGLASDVTDDGT